LHPAQAFEHPSEVINDFDLTLNEKRAILASWASDACATEAVPTLRCLPGGKGAVHFDEVMDAPPATLAQRPILKLTFQLDHSAGSDQSLFTDCLDRIAGLSSPNLSPPPAGIPILHVEPI
jgi:hypothetical protein